MIVLDGKSLALSHRENLKTRGMNFFNRTHQKPCLAVLRIGEDPASQVYVRNKIKACKEVGFWSQEHLFPSGVKQEDLESQVQKLNQDYLVHGILIQLPLPPGLDERKLLNTISPLKDVDGLTVENLGLLLTQKPRVVPCTPSGILKLLKHHSIPLSGSQVVVVGRSTIVGQPMALLLTGENATVTLCHSHTQNLKSHLQRADITVIAAGRPEFLGVKDFKPGVTVVDVGIHRKKEGGLCGDVCSHGLQEVVHAITPVPGGVGPMTISMLLENTLRLAQLQTRSLKCPKPLL